MPRPAESSLERALDRLAEVLDSKERARRWYESYLATLGSRAVVDTAENRRVSWVHRRAAGSQEVLPLPSACWKTKSMGERVLEGLEIWHGRQRITLQYDDDGRIADRSCCDLFPGRLVELPRVVAQAGDGLKAIVEFLAGLDDERDGPGRVHYPVPAPGGVAVAWATGLAACRRALFDGRVGDEARFIVADGLAGTAIGAGRTRDEALAAYAAEVARSFPARSEAAAGTNRDDDPDRRGNRTARGEGESDPPAGASSVIWQPPEDPEAIDPATGWFHMGRIEIRAPNYDAPPLPRRPECLPHVVLPLEASPEASPPRGRWVRLLGALGATRHVFRIQERDGFMLIGADLLGIVDLKSLRAELDRIDVLDPWRSYRPDHERLDRVRARKYRWAPATATTPEGLTSAGGSAGPRLDAAGLDGDELQAMVYRHRNLQRPTE